MGCQLEVLHRPVNSLPFAVAAQAVGAGEELEVLGDRELSVEREFLGDVADALPGRGASVAQVNSRHAQRAAAGREQAAQHPKRRRLPRSVGTEQTENLSPMDFKADMIDRRESPEAPDQVVYLDHGLACVIGPVGMRRDVGILHNSRVMRSGAMQQHHEAVFEARLHRPRIRVP